MDEAAARRRVVEERRRRGLLSARAAAGAASDAGARVSYTTWSEWENGKRPIGDSMRRAVMVLFDWPDDWPERPDDDFTQPPETTPPGGWVSLEQHVRLQEHVDSLAARVQELGAEVERLRKRADRVDV